jgi:hypothetical protein
MVIGTVLLVVVTLPGDSAMRSPRARSPHRLRR